MHYPAGCFKKASGSVVGHLKFRVQSSRFEVHGLGTRDWRLGARDWELGARDWGLGARDWGLGTRDLGLRASGYQSCFASQGFASIYIHLLVTDHIRIF